MSAGPTRTTATPKKRPTPTRLWQPLFLEVLRDGANVRAACVAAKVERSAAYRQRESDPAFAAAWAQAVEDACDLLEAEAWKRAKSGLSDLMIIFLLKAHRPELYRDPPARVDISGYVRLLAEREGLDPDEVMAEAERIMHGG